MRRRDTSRKTGKTDTPSEGAGIHMFFAKGDKRPLKTMGGGKNATAGAKPPRSGMTKKGNTQHAYRRVAKRGRTGGRGEVEKKRERLPF